VGLLFGLQLDRRTLRQFPVGFHLVAFGQALIALLVFAGVAAAAVRQSGLFGPAVDAVILAVAATAAVSSPAGVAMVSSNFLVRGQVRQFLFFVASLDAVVGLLALQLTYAYLHGNDVMAGIEVGGTTFWTGADLAVGAVGGLLFLWLMRLRPKREELVLYLLGISALVGGAALQLQLSPLVAAAVTGAVVANFERHPRRIYTALQQWEQPIYVVLLLLAGAQLRLTTWWVVPLGVGYFVLRAIAKTVGTAVVVRLVPLPFEVPRRAGLGLVPQGGITLAMALSLVLTLSGSGITVAGYPAIDLLFAVIIVGVVLSELVGPAFTQEVLRRAGELKPGVEEALEAGDDRRAEAVAMGRSPADATDPSDPSPQSDDASAPDPSNG
jgi:Kef-type K+ transport system membrane component KefB